MLLSIKSIFFINKIFTIIKGRIKLKLIKYNRFIQNEININLLNYKLFTGKYQIYEIKDIQKNMIIMMIKEMAKLKNMRINLQLRMNI